MSLTFSSVQLLDVHQDLYRNIISLRKSEYLFDDLSDDPEAWDSAQKLELETKPSFFESHQPVIHRPFEEADWHNAIGYPFTKLSESRFSDGSFGVWYGSDTLETTIYETAYHWTLFLSDAGYSAEGIVCHRKIYQVRCDSALIDLRPILESCPEIIHQNDYTATHELGSKIHREGHPGLITASARVAGNVYAVFNSNVLSDPRHNCYLKYTTTSKGIEVQKQENVTLLTVPNF